MGTPAEQSRWVRYGVAVLATLVGLGTMALLNPWVPMANSPFLVLFTSVLVSAWYGGMGPGVLATTLSTLAAWYFFLPPVNSWALSLPMEAIRLGLFAGLCTLISLLSSSRRRVINVLQQERDLFSAVVDTAGSLILLLDRQGRIVQFNKTCEQLTGLSFGDVQGKPLWDVVLPPEEVEAFTEVFRELVLGALPQGYENTWQTRTGDRRLIVWSHTALKDNRGVTRFVIATGIDITQRRQAEETLREANQTLETLVQSAPLAITVLDRQGRVKLWNPAATALFGWAAADVIGYALPTIPEDKWSEFQTNLEATLRGDVINGMETCRQRQDGSLVDIGLWTAVLRGTSTQDDRVLSISADLSDRKQAEAALKYSQERLMSLFDADLIGILFGDIDGGIEQANDEFLRMVGYSPEDLSNGNLDWIKITPAEYLPLDAERIAEAAQRGACTPYTKEYIRKDGSRIPVLVGYTLLGENRQHSVAFILDLTERQRLEAALRRQAEELAQANRMKDEFLAVLSHELRTPLNSMLGWSRLLRTRELDATTRERALETIERNARLQSQLIEDILDVSQIVRGKLRLHPRPVELSPIIDAAIDAMRPAAEAKAVCLVCEYASNVGMVSGDPDRLQQVFWNLLSNAIKFTPEGGRVEVQLKQVGNGLEHGKNGKQYYQKSQPALSSYSPVFAQVTVTDTGKGIDPDFLPFVFDRFRQADATTTRNEGGLGLGLAIVRHLVELHGGRVQVDSPGVGHGAMFTVRLPLINSDIAIAGSASNHRYDSAVDGITASPATDPTLQQLPASALAHLQVLLVDDEAEVRTTIKRILEEYGALVTLAGSTAEALQLSLPTESNSTPDGWKPDVLISDIVMPGEDGYALIRRLRALQTSRGIFTPALALVTQPQDAEMALSQGFQAVQSKPVEAIALVAAVAELTGRQGEISSIP